jgi:4-carboxymuconolactone decarboxylase
MKNGKITQTAGREQLGEFAPEFAHYNDDVLFGENWNNTDLDLRTRSLITVIALMAQGITDSSLKYHIQNAKNHGVSRKEMAAAVTHAAFYAGWPKAWAVFRLAKEVYGDAAEADSGREAYQNRVFFPVGEPNPYGEFFDGQSYLAQIADGNLPVFHVTFEPGCRNHWHIHHAKRGGGQMLICVGGRGFYQEEGKEAVEMTPGSVVSIPADVKHWHGAAGDSWFSHLAVEIPGEECATEWCEAITEETYAAAERVSE